MASQNHGEFFEAQICKRSAETFTPDGTEMDGEVETMRVIVDDEPPGPNGSGKYPVGKGDVEHFDSANDAIEALEVLRTSYDVLLLDINMLDLSGDLLDQQGTKSSVAVYRVCNRTRWRPAIEAFEEAHRRLRAKTFLERNINEALDQASETRASEPHN